MCKKCWNVILFLVSLLAGAEISSLFLNNHLSFIKIALLVSFLLAVADMIVLVILAIKSRNRQDNCLKCLGVTQINSVALTMILSVALLSMSLEIDSVLEVIFIGIWGIISAFMGLTFLRLLICIFKGFNNCGH